jgi:predicted nucleotidyltransferase
MNHNLINHTQLLDMARVMGMASGAKQVILFGSAARGTNTPDSDLDFLLVIPDQNWKWNGTTLEKLEPAAKARDAIRNAGYWMSLDVLPLPESRYNDPSSLLGSEAKRDGIILFDLEVANA